MDDLLPALLFGSSNETSSILTSNHTFGTIHLYSGYTLWFVLYIKIELLWFSIFTRKLYKRNRIIFTNWETPQRNSKNAKYRIKTELKKIAVRIPSWIELYNDTRTQQKFSCIFAIIKNRSIKNVRYEKKMLSRMFYYC